MRPNSYYKTTGGYQPIGPRLDASNPPQGGSGVPDIATQIVREFRIADRGVRIEIPALRDHVQGPKDGRDARPTTFERVVRIFLIFTAGWLFGYLHHFLAGR